MADCEGWARLSAPPPLPSSSSSSSSSPSDGVYPLAGIDSNARLALYIAMVHADLAMALLVLYGMYLLLADFLRLLQWALICSIPLRETQRALVAFWSPPLAAGVGLALLTIPFTVVRSFAATLANNHATLLRRRLPPSFSRLLRWLGSFIFLLLFERLGPLAFLLLPLFLVAAVVYRSNSIIQSKSTNKDKNGDIFTSRILRNLETLVAIGLMLGMIAGFLASSVFFSYKIGIEGKDAVMSLKTHVQKNNYTEKMGLKQWLDDNDILGMVDQQPPRAARRAA